MFFGKIVELKEELAFGDTLFHMLNIDGNNNNLYDSWQEAFKEQYWIKKLPKILVFQVGEGGLKFEEKIFCDRFLLENQEELQNNKNSVLEYKAKKHEYALKLAQFENFKNKNTSVP